MTKEIIDDITPLFNFYLESMVQIPLYAYVKTKLPSLCNRKAEGIHSLLVFVGSGLFFLLSPLLIQALTPIEKNVNK